jgi:hypothetical protein
MSTATDPVTWTSEEGPVLISGPLPCDTIEPVAAEPPLDRALLRRLGLSGIQFGSLQRRDQSCLNDADELRYALGRAGFPAEAMRVCAYRQGVRPEVAGLDDERRNDETIYVEIEA